MEKAYKEMLESIVSTCLGGPRGDPDESHCEAAACAVAILEDVGVEYEEELLEGLSDTVYGIDFLADARNQLKKLKGRKK